MAQSNHLDAWSVSTHQFPENGTAEAKLAFCVRYAILAPSPYNTQPWFFEVKGNTLSVFADRRFALPVTDPDDRGLVIAASAALYNLRLAIRNFGYEEETIYLPDPDRESLIARVRLGDKSSQPLNEEDQKRFQAISSFEFDHSAFVDKPVPEADIEAMKAAVADENAWLYICSNDDKVRILNMIAEADQMQAMSKNFRREFAAWTDKRHLLSGDGLPQYAQTFSKAMNNFSPNVARRFKNKEGSAAHDQEFIDGVPLLAILGSVTGGTTERVLTGQALMRLCLTAAARGLSVSTLNQVCEVPELRLRLHDEINQQGRAHVLLRIGYGGKSALNARRSLSAVLMIDGEPYSQSMFAGNDTTSGKKDGAGAFFRKISKVFLAKKAS